MERIEELIGADGLEIAFMEQVVGNSSPVDSPLMDAIREWVGEHDPGARGRADGAAGVHRLALVPRRVPGLRRPTASSRTATMCLYETWPLMHAADERIDVRDLGFAAEFFADLPRRLLA